MRFLNLPLHFLMGLVGLMGLMGLMGCNDITTYLTGGEGQPSAVEGEGTPSDEQTEDPTRQSGRDGVEFGLEIDGGGVDATVAVDRGDNGRVALVGGKGGVLDIEELSADLQCAIDGLAAMYPHGGAVSNLNRGGEFVVSYGETQLTDDVPKGRVVGSAQHHLIAGDGGARGSRHRIDSLDAVEEGNLVAFEK